MIFTAENILMVGSVLIFSGILISKTGYRFGIPTLYCSCSWEWASEVTDSDYSSTVLQMRNSSE